MVSNIQGPSVAISRLKSHFKNKHLDELGPDSFAFESIYAPEEGNGNSSDPSVASDGIAAVATPPRKKRSPKKTGGKGGSFYHPSPASEAAVMDGAEGGSSPATSGPLLLRKIQ
jgi:hypothetical protein